MRSPVPFFVLLVAGRRAEKDDDWNLRVRVLKALARTEPSSSDAIAHLERAAQIAQDRGFRPAEARALIQMGEQAVDDPAAADALTARGAKILAEIGLAEEAAAALSRLSVRNEAPATG